MSALLVEGAGGKKMTTLVKTLLCGSLIIGIKICGLQMHYVMKNDSSQLRGMILME